MLEYAQNRKAFSHCHATYQKELSLLFEKSGNFFSQSECRDRLDPPLPPSTPPPLFVFVRYLRNLLLPFHDERTIWVTFYDYVKCQELRNFSFYEVHRWAVSPSSICWHISVNSLVFIICSSTGVSVWFDSFSWEERLWILDRSKF